MNWSYEKLDENLEPKYCPVNDYDGSVTGHIVYGVKQWFDENPEERIRLGWIKHIHMDTKDIEYNKQTQYLVRTLHAIDEYTVEDVYHIMDKSEDMLLLEELLQCVNGFEDGITFYGGEWH